MKFRNILISSVFLGLASCVTVNDETVKDMPTAFLCRLMDSREYITLPHEQQSVYRELERRQVDCVSTQKVIIRNENPNDKKTVPIK